MDHLEDVTTPFPKLPNAVSIIVPTYQEEANILQLVELIDKSML